MWHKSQVISHIFCRSYTLNEFLDIFFLILGDTYLLFYYCYEYIFLDEETEVQKGKISFQK